MKRSCVSCAHRKLANPWVIGNEMCSSPDVELLSSFKGYPGSDHCCFASRPDGFCGEELKFYKKMSPLRQAIFFFVDYIVPLLTFVLIWVVCGAIVNFLFSL